MYYWDEANEEHVALHGLTPEDVEEAVEDPRRFFIPTYNTATERRYGVVGATFGGRIIRVIYTLRNDAYRIVTAHDASKSEKGRYKR